ncbi:hypothetical protein [Paractinoplanes deccanensis]|uniref:hypothetical protein n=1 Tax=Paractinoplanes deccanensis TaxID=113561 RepID=UPI003F68BBB9
MAWTSSAAGSGDAALAGSAGAGLPAYDCGALLAGSTGGGLPAYDCGTALAGSTGGGLPAYDCGVVLAGSTGGGLPAYDCGVVLAGGRGLAGGTTVVASVLGRSTMRGISAVASAGSGLCGWGF